MFRIVFLHVHLYHAEVRIPFMSATMADTVLRYCTHAAAFVQGEAPPFIHVDAFLKDEASELYFCTCRNTMPKNSER